ncbi:hypothetical protein GJAV_G00092790 [Gymnothorax javanicus]|nr:hypothetical protein GJAV_G00092790 [Gymnothorax javanicus]
MKRTLVYFSTVCSLINIISGCYLYAPEHVTGYTGGSAVLPCYCTDEPATSVRWFFFAASTLTYLWTYPDQMDHRYRDRAVIPGDTVNFPLNLQHLTQRDAGVYRCQADEQFRDITLTVKDPDCVLSEAGPKTITGFREGSIILPCVCTDVQSKPELVKWIADPVLLKTVIFPERNAPPNSPYRNRVQLLNSISPGNMSLRISGLTLTDEGKYRCEIDGQYREITLTVKDKNGQSTSTSISTPSEKTTHPGNGRSSNGPDYHTYVFVAIAVALMVIVCGVLLFYCKVKTKRNVHVESGEEKQISMKGHEEQAADLETYATVNHNKKDAHSAKYPTIDYSQKDTDSETYSTVYHSEKDADSVVYSTVNHKENGKNTVKNAKRLNQSEESTEYAAIKLS